MPDGAPWTAVPRPAAPVAEAPPIEEAPPAQFCSAPDSERARDFLSKILSH